MLKFQDTRQHFDRIPFLFPPVNQNMGRVVHNTDHGHEKAGTDVYAMFIVSIYSMCIFETECVNHAFFFIFCHINTKTGKQVFYGVPLFI